MPRLFLDASELFDFGVIGISTPETDYRICWALNKTLHWDLERADDIIPEGGNAHFALFSYQPLPEEDPIQLVANKYQSHVFLKDLPSVDYLLIFRGSHKALMDASLHEISRMETVFMAERIDITKIKSPNKEYLLL